MLSMLRFGVAGECTSGCQRVSRLAASALLLWASAGFAQSVAPLTPTVAVVGNDEISEPELELALGNRLLSVRMQEYAVRRAVLDELVEARLLAAEAKAARHVA